MTPEQIRALAESIARQINDGLPSCSCHERQPNEHFVQKITPALVEEIARHVEAASGPTRLCYPFGPHVCADPVCPCHREWTDKPPAKGISG